MRYAIVVAYDGTPFAGFQRQAGSPTVQEELERAFAVVLRQPVSMLACGRTDSGVHATGQVASFEAEPIPDLRRAYLSVNAVLSDSVRVESITAVPDDFHPRFSCVAREYEYLIWNEHMLSPHIRGRALWFRTPIPIDDLQGELSELYGERDWAAFTRVEHKDKKTIRYIDRIVLSHVPEPITGGRLVSLRIRGNAFLHNMIRILVGTVLDRTRGKVHRRLLQIREDGDRLGSGHTAPAHGLYFRTAFYDPIPGVSTLATLSDYPRFRRDPRTEGEA